MSGSADALSNAAAATLGTLFLRQVERELARLIGRVQILSALVFPAPDETATPDSFDSDLVTTLRTIAESVQDHLAQAHRALGELQQLPDERELAESVIRPH